MSQPGCPGCEELKRRVAELEALVRDLQARLGANASNSSLPPSANPPQAPKPVRKKKTGRRPGGQPGHPPRLRHLLPPGRVSRAHDFRPRRCRACDAPLPADPGPADPEPTRFQVIDLPDVAAAVTEYRGHARTCPGCGALNRAAVPAAVRAHAVGPRLTAVLSYLTGCHGLSRRAAEEVAEAVFAAPVSLGTVSNLEAEVSAALAPAHAAALAAVRAAAVKHADETGWKRAGRLCWLWAGATATVAAFVVHARRGLAGLAALLGAEIGGVVCSDRWSAYDRLPAERRQVCWAHLRRDFRRLADGGGAGAHVGRVGLRVARELFERWHLFRGGGLTRPQLQEALVPLELRLNRALLWGAILGADAKVARFCENVLALEPALWTFARADGVEPTNNHAERLRRRAVLWRKRSFGSHSEAGCRFAERVLTVVQTLRLQGRSVLAYMTAALTAHRNALPAPLLLPNG
jgi:transposase